MTNTVPQIFDEACLARQKTRALNYTASHHFLHIEAANMLCEHLSCMERDISHTLNLHCSTQHLNDALQHNKSIQHLEQCGMLSTSQLSLPNYQTISLNEPLPYKAASFDLITSAMNLHWVNDLPGLLVQTRRALKPNGLLLFNLLGAGTLDSLRLALAEADKQHYGGVFPRIIPFVDVKSLGMLLQRAGYEMPITDAETITVSYRNIQALMHDLRYMGEGNALVQRSKKPVSKRWLETANQFYKEHFGDGDGGILATFEMINATALAPA